jgi:NB-ARC domain
MNGNEALSIIDRILTTNHQPKLKDIQTTVVLQIWDGKSYPEIGKQLGYEPDYIKQVAAHLWQQLSKITPERVSKSNIRSILQQYQISLTKTDWGEAIDVSNFYDRQPELQILDNWITQQHCRFIGIFGWSGIGKTALSIKLAQQLESQFEYVIWRSIQQSLSFDHFLQEILLLLDIAPKSENIISEMIQRLRQKRCLLIFDGIESVLQPGDRSGLYIAGHEGYKQLFARISDENHQSCILITSREKPCEMTMREAPLSPVKSLQIQGLSLTAAQQILFDQGLSASFAQQQRLINYVHGHPLALKIVATTIQNLFSGDTLSFLTQGTMAFGSLRDLLEEQFDRLSDLQQQVMYWLAMNPQDANPSKIQAALIPSVAWPILLEALETLHNHSLISTVAQGFSLEPIILEYVLNRFVQQMENELITDQLLPSNSLPYPVNHSNNRRNQRHHKVLSKSPAIFN